MAGIYFNYYVVIITYLLSFVTPLLSLSDCWWLELSLFN